MLLPQKKKGDMSTAVVRSCWSSLVLSSSGGPPEVLSGASFNTSVTGTTSTLLAVREVPLAGTDDEPLLLLLLGCCPDVACNLLSTLDCDTCRQVLFKLHFKMTGGKCTV